MNDNCIRLVVRMLLNTMVDRHKQTWILYEQFKREKRLYVSIGEILAAKNNEEIA